MLRIERLPAPVSYEQGLALQESLVQSLAAGTGQETLLLLEHLPVYTIGRLKDRSSLGPSPELPTRSMKPTAAAKQPTTDPDKSSATPSSTSPAAVATSTPTCASSKKSSSMHAPTSAWKPTANQASPAYGSKAEKSPPSASASAAG
ncbi:Lipoate-protein ligase B, partial [sediment metagenome]